MRAIRLRHAHSIGARTFQRKRTGRVERESRCGNVKRPKVVIPNPGDFTGMRNLLVLTEMQIPRPDPAER
jgi:hypothetical protein